MSDEKDVIEAAVFGKQVEDFLSSDIGRYLVKYAERDAEAAVESLKRADPTEENQIRHLQSIIWRAESFQAWLAEAIMNGQQAMSVIEGVNDGS